MELFLKKVIQEIKEVDEDKKNAVLKEISSGFDFCSQQEKERLARVIAYSANMQTKLQQALKGKDPVSIAKDPSKEGKALKELGMKAKLLDAITHMEVDFVNFTKAESEKLLQYFTFLTVGNNLFIKRLLNIIENFHLPDIGECKVPENGVEIGTIKDLEFKKAIVYLNNLSMGFQTKMQLSAHFLPSDCMFRLVVLLEDIKEFIEVFKLYELMRRGFLFKSKDDFSIIDKGILLTKNFKVIKMPEKN